MPGLASTSSACSCWMRTTSRPTRSNASSRSPANPVDRFVAHAADRSFAHKDGLRETGGRFFLSVFLGGEAALRAGRIKGRGGQGKSAEVSGGQGRTGECERKGGGEGLQADATTRADGG